MVEGDLNTARLIRPRTACGDQNAEFRARTVTSYHCLSALKRICDRYRNLDTKGLTCLRAVLADARAQRLCRRPGRRSETEVSTTRCTTQRSFLTWRAPRAASLKRSAQSGHGRVLSLTRDVREGTGRIAELLAKWKPQKWKRISSLPIRWTSGLRSGPYGLRKGLSASSREWPPGLLLV
jgi:hypothetical protein